MKIKDIISAIESVAPLSIQEKWDNSGLQIGDAEAECTGALLCVDLTEAIVEEASSLGYNLVISHHPLIFGGLKRIVGGNEVERIVRLAIERNVAVYCAHTSADSAIAGVSHRMALKMGVKVEKVLVPQSGDDRIGLGVVCSCEPTPAMQLLKKAKEAFGVGALRYCGNTDVIVTRLALAGGACAEFWEDAAAAGVQLYLTADVKYHQMIQASDRLTIADLGHFESEQFTKEIFYEIIQKKFPNFAVQNAKTEINKIKYI